MVWSRGLVWVLLSLMFVSTSQAASWSHASTRKGEFTVKEVFLLGNKKTKPNIITREMSLKKGMTVGDSALSALIEEDRMKIYNTNLFNEVEIQKLYTETTEVILLVKVTERWYIFPSIIFKLADRNFNDWWVNQGRDFSRVNLGLRYEQFNFRGRREVLNLIFQLGFERRFLVNWRIPYIEKKQKHGLQFSYSYLESRNIGYETRDHVRIFVNDEKILRREQRAGITYRFRNSFYNRHRVALTFDHRTIDDTVALLNPNYFTNASTIQRNFDIIYEFSRDLRNNNNFATKGSLLRVRAEKTGLGIFNEVDIFDITLDYSKYFDLGKNFSYATGVTVFSSWPSRQPFERYNGLGFIDLVRGYEQDLIEGPRYALFKSTLRKRLFRHEQDISKVMPIQQFHKIPLALWVKIFFDAGYVENYPEYEISERLSNEFLYSGGVGIDIVTIHDLVIRIESSLNSQGQVRFALSALTDI
ncbi:MAG: BamA/TamA family outer membrane protein [Bacteroidota bacterium]